MTPDINKLLERLRTYYGDDLACRMLLMDARHALEAMAGEVAEALPWKLFYRDGLDLEQIGKRLGKSPYDFSPWLYAPLISQLKDREKTALADLAAERDRLAGEVERLTSDVDALGDNLEKVVAERDRLKGESPASPVTDFIPCAVCGPNHSWGRREHCAINGCAYSRENTVYAIKPTDAAPAVCVWAKEGHWYWQHGLCSGKSNLGGYCPACGKPIKFTEAK